MHIFFNNESCDVSISINTNIYFLDVFSVCSDPLSLYNNVMQVNLVLFVCQIKFTLLKYVLYVSFFQSGWVQPLTTYQVRGKYKVTGTSLDFPILRAQGTIHIQYNTIQYNRQLESPHICVYVYGHLLIERPLGDSGGRLAGELPGFVLIICDMQTCSSKGYPSISAQRGGGYTQNVVKKKEISLEHSDWFY